MKAGETLDGSKVGADNSSETDGVVYTSQTPLYGGLKLYARPVEVS